MALVLEHPRATRHIDRVRIERAVRDILEAMGEDPWREGLRDTPARVARMYQEIFGGLASDPRDELSATFAEEHSEMVIVRDIPFYSMCDWPTSAICPTDGSSA